MSGSGGIQLAPPPANHQPVIRHTDTQAAWQTGRQSGRQTEVERQTDRETESGWRTDKQRDRRTEVKTTDRRKCLVVLTNGQTDRQTDRDKRNDEETEKDGQLKVHFRQTVGQTDRCKLAWLLLQLSYPFGQFTYWSKAKRTNLKSFRVKSKHLDSEFTQKYLNMGSRQN